MVKENSEKKWFVLLVILVALSLVVELISLNVLYGITNNLSLSGELAVRPPKPPSSEDLCEDACSACESDCADYDLSNNCGTYCGGYYEFSGNSEHVKYVSCSDQCRDV